MTAMNRAARSLGLVSLGAPRRSRSHALHSGRADLIIVISGVLRALTLIDSLSAHAIDSIHAPRILSRAPIALTHPRLALVRLALRRLALRRSALRRLALVRSAP